MCHECEQKRLQRLTAVSPEKVMPKGPTCSRCHQSFFILPPDGVCDDCKEVLAKERLNEIILTTSIDVPNRTISRVLDIVASEAAIGQNVFKDIANNWRDFVGGRSNNVQNTLKEARQACLHQLRKEAFELGADAVIAIDLDYNEASTGSAGGILFVAASGTAVKLEP
jgi:uncharacterized protein YbjQ (UPF0145 family)